MKHNPSDLAAVVGWTDCVWHGCSRGAADTDAPLCGAHLVKAWKIVEDAGAVHKAAVEGAAAPRAGTVYFLRFSDRVKIGWTKNLTLRLRQLPYDELLHSEPGTTADERRCHAAFGHLREHGEWFRAESDLLDFIHDLRSAAAS